MHQPGGGLDRPPDLLHIGGVDVGEDDAVVGNDLVEEPRRSPVNIGSADDVVAGLEHGDQGRDGRHAAGKNVRRSASFERGQIFFERRARGIRNPGVFVSAVLTDLFLGIGGRGINRHVDRAGQRIGSLAVVDGPGRKAMTLLIDHPRRSFSKGSARRNRE